MKFVRSLVLVAALAALSACSAPEERAPTPAAWEEPSMYRSLARSDAEIDAEAARAMISQYRRNHGLSDLALDPDLQRIAQEQARDAGRQPKFDAKANALKERLAANKVNAHSTVANISAGYHTLAEAFSGWRQSAPHNAHMLEPRARRMGIATAYEPGAKYHVFWVLILAE